MAVSKNTMIGNAGEYYVCAELCKRNILALITPKNNPLFDIVASDPEGIRGNFREVCGCPEIYAQNIFLLN